MVSFLAKTLLELIVVQENVILGLFSIKMIQHSMNRSGETWLPKEIWGFTPGKMGCEFGAVIKTCVYYTGCMAVLLLEHKAHLRIL